MAIIAIAGAVILLGGALWGPIVSNVEQAKYSVVHSEDTIEIRDYGRMIVAETSTTGNREEAINQGFRTIADYIFGNNTAQSKIAMTTPVTQQATSEKIAMTAPVMQQGGQNTWTVRFVMPSEYTLDTLPKPNNDTVKLVDTTEARYAVIRFSGTSSKENITTHESKLLEFLDKNKLKAKSQPIYAFFNPPMTLPMFRRNEVMVEIERSDIQ